jgi:hypothetical protein
VDDDVIGRVDDLIAEEHRLRSHADAGTRLSDEDQARLAQIEVRLDQCWDLLRQRRARRAAGQDPGDASVRDPSVVENYRQ